MMMMKMMVLAPRLQIYDYSPRSVFALRRQ